MTSSHSSQFKQDAVKLASESDQSIAQTARGLTAIQSLSLLVKALANRGRPYTDNTAVNSASYEFFNYVNNAELKIFLLRFKHVDEVIVLWC